MSDDTIQVPEWWVPGGGMMYRRDALPPEHPESTWSYIRKHYPDADPRDFGVEAPKVKLPDECPCCGHRLV